MSETGEGWSDSKIVAAMETSASMVYRVRKQLVEEGLAAVLSRKQRATPAVVPIFDGEKEAKLIALACSEPPEGRARWTLRLLERKVEELEIVDRASDSTIGRVLKKHSQAPSPRTMGHPAQGQRAFVAAMEDVLAVCTRPRDPDRPLVCLDETSKQLIAETRLPIPMKPGRPARCDYEYERNGIANLFMTFAPLEGWRCVKVTDRHTAVDYAHVLKDLAETRFPGAKVIVLIQDNSTSTAKLPSTRRSRPPKPGGWSSASNGITRRNTAAGWIWPSPNSLSYRPNVSTAAYPISKPLSTKSPLGKKTATKITPRLIGTSQPQMHASNSSTSTLQSD